MQRLYLKIILLALCIGVQNLLSAQPIIQTIAGTGTASYTGDGGQATAATLNEPYEVCIDNAGNVLIVDGLNHCIREINHTTDIITTIAGTGVSGYSGDGGLAVNAQLNNPSSIAVDQFGNIYIADWHNHVVRVIDTTTGIITTIAGTGVSGYSGDGGQATNAQMEQPIDVVVDTLADMLYIADQGNSAHCVRRVDLSTGIITTIAGNGTNGYSGDGGQAINAQFDHPRGLALDYAGHLYITDGLNDCIRVVDLSTGIVNTYAGTGLPGYNGDGIPATSAQLDLPGGLAIDAMGNLIIADIWNERIRIVDASTGIINTIAGTGVVGYNGDGIPAITAQLNKPRGVAVNASGNVFIADHFNHRIRKIGGPLPVAYFTADDTTICEGESIQFTDTSFNSPTSWQWTFNGGIPATSMLQNPVVTYPNAGTYSVKLVVSNSAGSDSLVKTNYIQVNPNPTAQFSADSISGCITFCTQFTDLSLPNGGNITGYSWQLDGANVSSLANPIICINEAGKHDVTLIVTTQAGCVDTLTKLDYLTGYTSPVANFGVSNEQVPLSNPVIQFTNLSVGATSQIWNFGDGNTTTIKNPTHKYADTGRFCITLQVANNNGCTDDTVQCIRVLPNTHIYIPNSFTPNADGLNDVFKIYGEGLLEVEMLIFNRWGEEIYATIENIGWNGYMDNSVSKVPLGIYVYKIKIIDQLGEKLKFIGRVNVLR